MEENYLQHIDFFSDEEIEKLLDKNKESFIGVIPKGIQDKDELMRVYYNKLNLAPYFGGNWDALDEVLIDFDWINGENIIILHLDVPKLELKDQKTMLDVLGRAVKIMHAGPGEHLLPTGKHKLQVIFPLQYKKQIEELMKSE